MVGRRVAAEMASVSQNYHPKWYNSIMNAIVEIDKAGRIVIPKKMRDAMGLTAGSRLRVEQDSGELRLEADFPEPQLEVRDGLLVMVGGPPVTVEDVNAAIRQGYEERHQRIMEGSGLK